MKKRLLVILVVSVILLGAFSFTNSITTDLYSCLGTGEGIDHPCSHNYEDCSSLWGLDTCWCHDYGFMIACLPW